MLPGQDVQNWTVPSVSGPIPVNPNAEHSVPLRHNFDNLFISLISVQLSILGVGGGVCLDGVMARLNLRPSARQWPKPKLWSENEGIFGMTWTMSVRW